MPFAQNWEANLGSTWTGTEEGFQKSRQCSFRRGKSHTDTNPSGYHASLGSWLSILHSKPGSFLKYFCQSQKPLYFIKTFRIHCILCPSSETKDPTPFIGSGQPRQSQLFKFGHYSQVEKLTQPNTSRISKMSKTSYTFLH